jgi:transglutaminase-like putative cysteine protease
MLKRTKSIKVICSLMVGVVFALAMLITLTVVGVLRLNRTALVIQTEGFEAKYDGAALTNYIWKITKGELKDSHTIEVTFTGTQTFVGESYNGIDVVIRDELGADVTSDYNIQFNLGVLKVNPRLVVLMPDENSLNYLVLNAGDGLVRGHTVDPRSMNDEAESDLAYANIVIRDMFGADVTRNYRIILSGDPAFGGGDLPGGGNGGGNGGGDLPGGGSGGGSGGGDLPGGGSGGGSGGGNGGGGGSNGEFGDGEFGEFPQDTVLYEIYANEDASLYLREMSYGDYTGKGWLEADEYGKLLDEQYSALYLTSLALENSGAVSNMLKIRAKYDLYVLPYYLSPTQNVHTIQSSDILSVGEVGEEYTVSYLGAPTRLLKLDPSYTSFEREYRDYVYSNYTSIDETTAAYMQAIIDDNGNFGYSGRGTVMQTVDLVAKYIQSSAAYNLQYDKALEDEENMAIAFLDKYKEGVCRHYAMAATLMYRTLGIPARYTVGIHADAVANEWTEVTADKGHAWVEVYIDGMGWMMVEVTGGGPGGGSGGGSGGGPGGSSGGNPGDAPDNNGKSKLEIFPETVYKKYDGTPLYSNGRVYGTELKNLMTNFGYYYEVEITGSRTDYGKSYSDIVEGSFKLYNAAGEDVTDEYNVVLQRGIISIYYSVLSFESNDINKIYDGTIETNVTCLGGELMEGHSIVTPSTASPNAGKSLNMYDVKVLDKNGNNVTDYYRISRKYGSVNIERKAIEIKAADATKVFDGTELTCNKIEYIEGLVEGHTLSEYNITGSQTSCGRSDNVIDVSSIVIRDAYGNDVTMNYEISTLTGKLSVTRS